MELEVSKKVREAIKAKLLELGCHVDDELPDYIMILIANRRSNQEIEGDLSLFLADNTKRFVGWLTHVLKKLEQVTASDAAGKKEVEEKKNDPPPDKSIEDKDETVEVKIQEEVEKKSVKLTRTRRYSSRDKKSDEKSKEAESKAPVVSKQESAVISVRRHEIKSIPYENTRRERKGSRRSDSFSEEAHIDTLILDSGENEFDNLDELRRIALESQAKKRKDIKEVPKNENVHQRKLITNILMTQKEKDSSKSPPKPFNRPIAQRKTSSSSSLVRSPERSSYINKSKEYPQPKFSEQSERIRRILRSPRRQERRSPSEKVERRSDRYTGSVFSRIGPSSSSANNSRSRSRSRSPAKRLTSRIGIVIRRSLSPSNEDRITSHSINSVVKVADRPKRDLQLSNKMLLRAVADAQQSIIQTEQNSPKLKPDLAQETASQHELNLRKRTSDDNMANSGVIPKRRFPDLSDVGTQSHSIHHAEPVDSPKPRISVKERLGVKRDIRRPVKERLGIIESFEPQNIDEENLMDDEYEATYSPGPGNDYQILINVNDQLAGLNGKMRNVMLAANESKRISIQVNNSEEDSSDESNDEDSSPERKEPATKIVESTTNGKKEGSDVEFELDVLEEDKLPEVPTEAIEQDQVEYEYEEIVEEEEETSIKIQERQGRPATVESNNSVKSQSTQDSQEQNFSITINKVLDPSLMKLKSNLPDLRTYLGKPNSVPGMNGASGLKCKFWPKCQFKDKCIYEHPKCKYTPCKNKDCIYKHDKIQEAVAAAAAAAAPPKLVCKFYPKCTSMNCKFHHPSPCRFGVGCTDSRCENYHPGVTLGIQKLKAKGIQIIPKANQLKWVKK